jgi:hypothetical protein
VRLPRRTITLALTGLTAVAVLPAGVADAASVRRDQACPSYAGEVLTRPGYPWYLVDRFGNLRGLPPGVPDRIFAEPYKLRTDVPLEVCGLGEDLSADAAVVTAGDATRPWYVYTQGKKYGISPGCTGYHFGRSKLQLWPASVLDPIPDRGLWC